MYAHQVIEDIKNTENNNVIPFIKSCQHFFAGEVDQIDNAVQCAPWESLQSIKMPYHRMWIEFYQDNKKMCTLLWSLDKDNSLVSGLSFIKYENYSWRRLELGWVLSTQKTIYEMRNHPMMQHILVGRPFPDFLENREGHLLLSAPKDYKEFSKKLNDELIYFTMKFMLLLNCKNITTEIIKAPEALNKKRCRNGKQEIFDYHVLNVVVPSYKQGYREKIEPLSHVRVHLCRGHFKEYTNEHPLFGKLTGLYWWQPHVRGQNREGIVLKDYRVSVN